MAETFEENAEQLQEKIMANLNKMKDTAKNKPTTTTSKAKAKPTPKAKAKPTPKAKAKAKPTPKAKAKPRELNKYGFMVGSDPAKISEMMAKGTGVTHSEITEALGKKFSNLPKLLTRAEEHGCKVSRERNGRIVRYKLTKA